MAGSGRVLVHAIVRALLVFGACTLAFGPFAAYLAALSAAALVPYEAWCRARARWRSRCATVLGAAPIAVGLVWGLPYHTAYAQQLHLRGWAQARSTLSEGLTHWPADPDYDVFELTQWLEALPWHRANLLFTSYTLLETALVLAAVLTIVVFGGVFLGGARPTASERAWQALTAGVGGAVIGLACYASHTPVTPQAYAVEALSIRPDPLWLWAYLILVGTACPLAGVIGDWLTGLPPARSDPAPRSAILGAGSAAR